MLSCPECSKEYEHLEIVEVVEDVTTRFINEKGKMEDDCHRDNWIADTIAQCVHCRSCNKYFDCEIDGDNNITIIGKAKSRYSD